MTPDERAALRRLLDVCNHVARNRQFRCKDVAVIEDILRDLRIVHQMLNRMEVLDGRTK